MDETGEICDPSAPTPAAFDNPSTDQLAAQTPAWVTRWTQVVLK
jgi:hypothetical protein